MINLVITKTKKLQEINNDMTHNFYYLYYGRIYNENMTRFYRFKYVFFFDIYDLQEFYEKDVITKSDIKEYINNYELPCYMKNFDDKKGLKDFYEACNESIENWNKIACYYNY